MSIKYFQYGKLVHYITKIFIKFYRKLNKEKLVFQNYNLEEKTTLLLEDQPEKFSTRYIKCYTHSKIYISYSHTD